MRARVRCPSPRCAAIFELSAERLGRNVYCLSCGTRMTARPIELEPTLERREAVAERSGGADVPRLPLVVLVDNVRSLWNVGSIFRTADACGVAELTLAGITGCPPRAEISKTALGAEQVVAWSYCADPLRALRRLQGAGFTAVAVESTPEAVPLHELEWPERTCLVVGNEVAGISPVVLDACERHVYIPMCGVKQTLNVAVAFGVAAHEAARALVQSHPSVRFARPSRQPANHGAVATEDVETHGNGS